MCAATQWIQGWELSSPSTEQSLLRKDHSELGVSRVDVGEWVSLQGPGLR